MKIGVIGAGQVGATAAYAMMMRGVGSEIVLVDRKTDLAVAQAHDILDATPWAYPVRVRAGEIADLAGAGLVVLAAGANQKPGESRLDLLSRNAEIFAGIIPAVLADANRSRIDTAVRRAAYNIIQGKGATWFGVGAGLARIAQVIQGDERALITCSMMTQDCLGVRNVALSLPRVLGGGRCHEDVHAKSRRRRERHAEAECRDAERNGGQRPALRAARTGLLQHPV